MKKHVLELIRRAVGFFQLREKVETIEERLDEISRNLAHREADAAVSHGIPVTGGIEQALGEISAHIERMNSAIQAQQDSAALAYRMDQAQLRDSLYDLKLMISGYRVPPVQIDFQAEKRIAVDSPDHIVPWGTRNDNSRHPGFVRRAEQALGEIRHLDVGCAGGGLVWDFSLSGHLSVGVEGSDYNLRAQRAEWRMIPDRLFTADITQPFSARLASGERILFNLITAWELFEHIPTKRVDDSIANLLANATPDALLVCSIAMTEDRDAETGLAYHQTVQTKDWWLDRFARQGLHPVEGLFNHEDFVRGSGNPRSMDWDSRANPEIGFHLVLRRNAS